MQKLCLLLLAFVVLWGADVAMAVETNQVTTNTINSGATNQLVPPNMSDPELQAQAKDVLWMIIGFWIVALVGALVVAGFALYGAYKKFGGRGVAVVVVILLVGLWMFGEFLLSF